MNFNDYQSDDDEDDDLYIAEPAILYTATFAFCFLTKDETKIFDSVAQDDLVGPMLHAEATLS